jgi:hypothetical protein
MFKNVQVFDYFLPRYRLRARLCPVNKAVAAAALESRTSATTNPAYLLTRERPPGRSPTPLQDSPDRA